MGDEGDEIQPFRYAGYRWDEETQLYYLNARYYDPSLVRFVSADAWLGRTTSPLLQNRYAYTRNNPVNFDDPSGFIPDDMSVGQYLLQKQAEARAKIDMDEALQEAKSATVTGVVRTIVSEVLSAAGLTSTESVTATLSKYPGAVVDGMKRVPSVYNEAISSVIGARMGSGTAGAAGGLGWLVTEIWDAEPTGEICPQDCPWQWTDPIKKEQYYKWALERPAILNWQESWGWGPAPWK